MSLRNLPEVKNFKRPAGFQWDAPTDVMSKWAGMPLAAEADDPATISIYEPIGEDIWGDGFTAKRTAAALRSIGKNPVTVKINSPGGDMFEGLAIYNLLREHPAKVQVDVIGIAASAASIIAMSGDQINMGLGSFMMIHNAWGMVIGNRHDMREAADLFDGFDAALADIYEARTARSRKDIEKWMDAETFMSAREAVKNGFADAVNEDLETPDANHSMDEAPAARRIEIMLAKAGMGRNERRSLIGEVTGNPAVADRQSSAVASDTETAAIKRLIETLRS